MYDIRHADDIDLIILQLPQNYTKIMINVFKSASTKRGLDYIR